MEGQCLTLRREPGLAVPFNEHWSVNSRGPALLLNTTWSETGYRVGFAPFPLYASSEGTLYNFEEIAARAAVRRSLIEAAVVSARVPGIVPAWHFDPLPNDGRRQRWNFVDGGYVDNSGSTSAVEIYEQIAKIKGKLPFQIDLRLVLLTNSESALDPARLHGSSYSDTVAPLKALLAVRSQLSSRAIAETIKRLAPGVQRRGLTARETDREMDSAVWLVNLEQGAFPLPLGWKISRITNVVVGYMLGRPEWCRPEAPAVGRQVEVQRALDAVIENSCVKSRILSLIRSAPDPS